MLMQTPLEAIRYANIQRRASFVREDVNPIIVVAHRSEMIRDISVRRST
jgi:hypothetical protein